MKFFASMKKLRNVKKPETSIKTANPFFKG
jgi:hypothetical protein